MHTGIREPICSLSASATNWWDSRSPEKQRAHIKRHPNGRYAKAVRGHKLALKPLNNQASRKRIGLRGEPAPAQGAGNAGGDDQETGEGAPEEEEEGGAEDGTDDGEKEQKPEPKPEPAPEVDREDVTSSYRRALPQRLKDGVKAFFAALDDDRPIGTRADLSDSAENLRKGDVRKVVKKMKPKTEDDAKALYHTIKAVMPLAKIVALAALGVVGAASPVLPALLACYYVNRTLSIESLSRSAAYRSLSGGDECDRLVNSFMDWAEGLDKDTIQQAAQASEFTSTSSGLDIQVRRCPLDYYRGLDEECGRRYLLVVGRKVRGFVKWDKKYGTPNKESNGWFSVLVDGFNENAYRSDRDDASLEPYTAIHNNDLVLVNPARMPYEFAKQWAMSVLRR